MTVIKLSRHSNSSTKPECAVIIRVPVGPGIVMQLARTNSKELWAVFAHYCSHDFHILLVYHDTHSTFERASATKV